MSRTRNWCFTVNNYTQEEYDRLSTEHKQVRFIIFGKETGEKEETPHLQGFVSFHNAKTFKQVKQFFGDRAHIEETKGTVKENIAYCSKQEDFFQYGDPPKQGARNDLELVKQMVSDGKTMSEIIEESSSYQSIRMAEVIRKYQPIKVREKPQVRWYYGPSGTGKTYQAYQELGYENTWVSSDSLQWFDSYDGQKNVIIDDFRGSMCRYAFLLRLLDRYPLRVPVKGGFVNWTPDNIYITSCHHPKDVYTDENILEDIGQLIRRIDIIQKFDKKLN